MALVYDLESDIRFLQGREKEKIEAIKKMLQDNLSIEQIIKYLDVSRDFVMKIAESIKK